MEIIISVLIVLFAVYALNLFDIRTEQHKKKRKKRHKNSFQKKNYTIVKTTKQTLHYKKKIYNTEVEDLYHTHVESMWNEIK